MMGMGLEVFAVNQAVVNQYLAEGEANEVRVMLTTPSSVFGARMVEPAILAVNRSRFHLTWSRAYGTGIKELWLLWDNRVMVMLRPTKVRVLHLSPEDTLDLKFNFKVVS